MAALRRSRLLDTFSESEFDRLTGLARRLLGVPVSLITLVDHDRQFFKSQQGLPEPWASLRETPLSHSFCQHVVASDNSLVVEDARHHPLVYDNLAIGDLGVIAYLGVPVHSPDGYPIGSLCVIDSHPRVWADDDVACLRDLVAVVESELVLRASVSAHARAEAQYRALFESSPDAVLVLDPETEAVIDANDPACELYGQPRAVLVGSTMKSASPDSTLGEALVAQLMAKGGSAQFESVHRRYDGTPFDVAISASLVQLADHAVVLSVNRDVTAQKATQEALLQSEAQFRQIAEALPQLVWILDPDGKYQFYNGRFYDYTGTTADDRLRRWQDTIHPDDLAESATRWERSLATGEPYETEYRIRRASDGAYRWFLGRAEPVRNEAGTVVRWFGTCTDIHDLHEVQERLHAQGEQLRLVHSATSDVVWDWDVGTGVISWGPAIADVLGWDDAVAGTDLAWLGEKLHPEDRSRAAKSFGKVTEGEETVWKEEYRFRRANGTYAFVLNRGYVVRDSEGAVVRVVGAMVDLSERKAVELELVAAREAAETAARLKSSLLANMSHEIRTPLTAILGYAEMLAAEAPLDIQNLVEPIWRGGSRLMDTLNSVLDLAQIEAGEVTLSAKPADLLAEVDEACAVLRPLALAKGLDLRVVGSPAWVLADRPALSRVLTNLIGNAVKFTDSGSITVEAGSDDAWGWVRVSDTGVGIAPEFLPALFSEFKQESEGHGRAYEGNGLGLAIAKRLVDLMGGEIAVVSEKGVGSVFTLRLPLSTD